MARTMQDCFDAAVSYSSLNNASLYDEDMALIHMSFFEQLAFLRAGEINPNFYGRENTTATRSAHDDSWNLTLSPGDNIGIIEKVEVAAVTGSPSLSVGDKVNIIDINFPEFQLSPRCYIRDNKIFNYNDELGADDTDFVSQLKLYYSFVPTVATDLTDDINLNDRWAHLIIIPMASILALSDMRPEDYDRLRAEHQENMDLFLTYVGAAASREPKPLMSQPILNPGSIVGNQGGG